MRYQAAIFDMDGTILNTVEDLTSSLNYALRKTGHRCDFTPDEVRRFFGSGALVASRRALWCEKTGEVVLDVPEDAVISKEADQIQQVFRGYYVDHCAEKTGPYPGIPELLQALQKAGIPAAVVSNKPDDAVRKLSADYFSGLFAVSVGEMEGVRKKPAPDTVWKVCRTLGTDPKTSVYIGDSEVDIETAKNAGTHMISVDWGFRTRSFLEALHPEHLVSDASSLRMMLLG
ncbi:MAG: HAD family hydrolase [Lachnospiraceae bacterium]